VYRVEKSKDCNRSGEVLSTFNLERLSCFSYIHYTCGHCKSNKEHLLF
jgi:hypothetical protein